MPTLRQRLVRARPLAGAHGFLAVVMVALGVFLLLLQPCKRGPYELELVAVAVTVCVLLWSNHVARAPVRSARAVAVVVGRSLYDFFVLTGLVLVAYLPIAVFQPTYQCYTDQARASAREVLLMVSPLRLDVENNAIQRGAVEGAGRGLVFTPAGRARAGFVTKDGEIVAVGDDPVVVFMLSPTFAEGSVHWTCRGFPEKVVPAKCRGQDAN